MGLEELVKLLAVLKAHGVTFYQTPELSLQIAPDPFTADGPSPAEINPSFNVEPDDDEFSKLPPMLRKYYRSTANKGL